jgi:hypothetical protein
MISLSPLNSICFLLDFVNEKEWSKQIFRDLQIKHHLISSEYGDIHGYEETAYLRKFDGKRFFVCEKTHPMYLDFLSTFNNDDNIIEQKTLLEEDFFRTLVELQASWRDFLEITSRIGHNLEFLNEIAKEVTWQLVGTTGSFSPKIGAMYFTSQTMEDFLEFNYLYAVTGFGDFVKRLRFCNNSICDKMFVYNRPKQIFCEEACRHAHNNREKIETGYLAAHQAKGRRENPVVYKR